MWNLKNKTGKQTQQNRNRVIDTEYKQVVGEGGQGMNEVSEDDENAQTSSFKIGESWVCNAWRRKYSQ